MTSLIIINKYTLYWDDYQMIKKNGAIITKPHQTPADYMVYQILKKKRITLKIHSVPHLLFHWHLG